MVSALSDTPFTANEGDAKGQLTHYLDTRLVEPSNVLLSPWNLFIQRGIHSILIDYPSDQVNGDHPRRPRLYMEMLTESMTSPLRDSVSM